MMQVQKGQVRYKDRNDIICTYGSVADQADKKYFFLDWQSVTDGDFMGWYSLDITLSFMS